MKLEPLTPVLGARATDIDLGQPLDTQQVQAIEDALDQHAVLVFPGQCLGEADQMAFARCFGPIDLGFQRTRDSAAHRLGDIGLADISNVMADGSLLAADDPRHLDELANQLWHSDGSFQRPRSKYSMLYAVAVPPLGGETEFADLRAAWDALPAARQRQLDGLVAVHYALHTHFQLGNLHHTQSQREAIAPTAWPLVQTDPRSGRRALYLGAHACELQGRSVPEGRMLLMDLLEHATQRHFVYSHAWQPGDLLMWDNTTTTHRSRATDRAERRELRRATTEELVPSPEALALWMAGR